MRMLYGHDFEKVTMACHYFLIGIDSDIMYMMQEIFYVLMITLIFYFFVTEVAKLTEKQTPHIAIFLNDVQRKNTKKENEYGINSTFLPGHFKGYTVKLNPLDGVYYCDIRPNMITESILKGLRDDTFQKMVQMPMSFFSKNQTAELSIRNILGDELQNIDKNKRLQGANSITIDLTNLPTGIYFCRLQSGSTAIMKKVFHY